LGADVDGLAKYAYELATNRAPSEPFLLLGQMTTADATRSPAGTESLWVYTHVPHGGFDVAAQVQRVEDVIERHAPGFRDRIVARHVAGPDELERENPSLVGGAINGGSAAVFQQLVLRPIPGLGRADTPIDRLYLAGSSAHPGGGVHGAAGANAARAALARHRRLAGPVYGSAMRAANRVLYPR
jgi:phytoene dehydrogenase-like protein